MKLREKLRAIWAELRRSDNYRTDWYGAAKNQIAHTFIGAMFAVLFAVWSRLALGEMLVREHILTVTIVGYIAFEWVAQGYKGTDTLADALFFGLGGVMVIAPFREVSATANVTTLDFYHWHFLMAYAAWIACFVPYVWRRISVEPPAL